MKDTLETRLGIFFALAFIAAVLLMEMLGSFDFFKRGIRIHALFNTVQELKEGDPVKMAGVQIGRVEKIDLKENKVDVTLKLDRAASVKTDSKGMIKFAGLMGQNFVSISFGSRAGRKVVNDTIIETEEQPDLNALMVKLENVATGVENVTRSLSGDSVQNLLGPLTDFLKENSPRLTAILSNLKTISTQIAEGKGTLGKLAKDDALYKEATTAMTNLKEIFQKINQGQGSVGKLISDESLYKNAKLSLQKLDTATEGLEDQGPLSVLGIAIGKLF